MQQSQLIVSCIYIVFFLVKGFVATTDPEINGTFLHFLIDASRFNISTNNPESSTTDHVLVKFNFITNNYNLFESNHSESPESTHRFGRPGLSETKDFLESSFPKLNDQCTLNKDCRHVPYAVCSFGTCSCKTNYIPAGERCKALIDETCEEDSDCWVGSSECQFGACGCKTGHYSPDISKCNRFAKVPGDYCEDNQGCLKVQYSTCSENSCECKNNYMRRGDICLGLINATCSSDQECLIKNSICQFNTCQCPDGFYLYGDTCYKYAVDLYGECRSNEACKFLPYSTCNYGQCFCLPNYEGSSGKCLGMFNATCSHYTECVASNAICDKTCQCPDNHYFENMHCYQYADRPYVPIATAQACQRLAHTVFAENRCECAYGHYYDANRCFSIPSDYEIPVNSSKACDYLQDAYYFEGKCYRRTLKLHDSCQYDHQCKIPSSKCVNRTCRCQQNYIEHDHRCYGSNGTQCSTAEDCATVWFSCESGTCQRASQNKNGVEIALKPGATARWEKYDKNVHSERSFYNRTVNSELQTLIGNLTWKKENYTLDSVASLHTLSPSTVTLWCRIETTDGKFVFGKITLPGNELCTGELDGETFKTGNYSVLTDRYSP